jgi:Family of unknown function (DUF6134)
MRRILAGIAIILAVSAPAAPSAATGEVLDFAIVRNGSDIGYHRIRFTRDDKLVVDIDVDVRVTVMSLTVYRFCHLSREVWEQAQFVALTAETDDDGTQHSLSVTMQGDEFEITHNGVTTRSKAGQIPTSQWNRAAVARSALLGTLRGDLLPTVTRLGPTILNAQGRDLEAEGYLIDAKPDFKRWVWYDASGRLVAVRLEGPDGSRVSYRLR